MSNTHSHNESAVYHTPLLGFNAFHFAPNTKGVSSVDFNHSRYSFARPLGEGSYSLAATFSNQNKERIVVKAAGLDLENKFGDQIKPENHTLARRKREHEFMQILYPEFASVYAINEYHLNKKNQKADFLFSISPYFPGIPLPQLLRQARLTQEEALLTFLAVAEELQRIHDIGILHGDLGLMNILIDVNPKTRKPKVYFIDLEWAYKINDKEATTITTSDECYWAPERVIKNSVVVKKTLGPAEEAKSVPQPKFKIPAPNYNQDTYSLAEGFRVLMARHGTRFPESIVKILAQQKSIDPANRPPLRDLIVELQKALKQIQEKRQESTEKLFQSFSAIKHKSKQQFLRSLTTCVSGFSREQILTVFSEMKDPNGKYAVIHEQRHCSSFNRFRLFFKSNKNGEIEKNFWHTSTYQEAVKILKEAYIFKTHCLTPVLDGENGLINYVRGNAPVHRKATDSAKDLVQRTEWLPPSLR